MYFACFRLVEFSLVIFVNLFVFPMCSNLLIVKKYSSSLLFDLLNLRQFSSLISMYFACFPTCLILKKYFINFFIATFEINLIFVCISHVSDLFNFIDRLFSNLLANSKQKKTTGSVVSANGVLTLPVKAKRVAKKPGQRKRPRNAKTFTKPSNW